MPRKMDYLVAKRRRFDWIVENGPCRACGSTEELEVDHIDRSLKTMEPYKIWQRTESVRLQELSNCQVLCKPCHIEKSRKEMMALAGHGDSHCRNGHPFSSVKGSDRRCYTCENERKRAKRAAEGPVRPWGPYNKEAS